MVTNHSTVIVLSQQMLLKVHCMFESLKMVFCVVLLPACRGEWCMEIHTHVMQHTLHIEKHPIKGVYHYVKRLLVRLLTTPTSTADHPSDPWIIGHN